MSGIDWGKERENWSKWFKKWSEEVKEMQDKIFTKAAKESFEELMEDIIDNLKKAKIVIEEKEPTAKLEFTLNELYALKEALGNEKCENVAKIYVKTLEAIDEMEYGANNPEKRENIEIEFSKKDVFKVVRILRTKECMDAADVYIKFRDVLWK